jgi:hypothetical protein
MMQHYPRRSPYHNPLPSDVEYESAMKEGSDALRDSINAFLDQRAERERRVIERNDAARKAIAAGWLKAEVQQRYELSETAYEQLAGQVRAGGA